MISSLLIYFGIYYKIKIFSKNDLKIKKNDNIMTKQINETNKHFWFNCGCLHDFKTTIKNTTGINSLCPYCSGSSICGKLNCIVCHPKSFASYNETINNKLKIDCYHFYKNGNIKPKDININSNKIYWFYCSLCNCNFDKQIINITKQNEWCQNCIIPHI